MEIYIYSLILTGYLALAFLSRDEEGRGLRKMAGFLYRQGKRLGQKSKRLHFFTESAVRRDIALLYPFGRTKEEEERFYTERIRLVLMILLAGTVLAAAGYVAAGDKLLITDGNKLVRDEIGGEDRSTEVDAYLLTRPKEGGEDRGAGADTGPLAGAREGGESGNAEPVYQGSYQLEVRARKYSEDETREMAEKVFAGIPEMILGGNESLADVRTSLELPSQIPGMPFRISWESSSYALVDADGSVGNTVLEEGDSQNVTLTAVLTYDNGTAAGIRYERPYEITVHAPRIGEQDRLSAKIREAILTADEKSAAEGVLPLPESLEDHLLVWEEKPADPGPAVLLFACLTAFLSAAAMGSRLHEKVVRRERQMMLDYPGIISKFVLYLGAGLSVRSTFFKIGEDYERRREEGIKERYVYEEILFVCRELTSGVPETEAYARFGQRCRYRQYTKLSALLAQNLRKGNSALLTVMQQEAQASFEERRNTARRLGEEAETKLLLPMIAMLAITMLMIIIPAYYGFAA